MRTLLFIYLFSLCGSSNAQQLRELKFYQLPAEVAETSGMIYYNGQFITINDSGNEAALYFLTTFGELAKIIPLQNVKNADWEDLAIDSKNCLYVGDFGNNMNKRKNLVVYKLDLNDAKLQTQSINFYLSDQHHFPPTVNNRNFDLEAMVVLNDTLHIFSKNNTKPYNGYSKRYTLSTQSGSHIAQLRDSFFLGDSGFYFNSVTAADYSAKNNRLLLLCYQHLYVFWNFKHSDFFSGNYMKLNFGWLTQKESVCMVNDTIFITDEKKLSMGGKLRSYEIESYFNGDTKFQSSEVISVKVNRKKNKELELNGIVASKNKINALVYLKNNNDLKAEFILSPDQKGKFSKIFSEVSKELPANCILQLFEGKKLIYSVGLQDLVKK